ncbi:HEAT repeat-containing protein 6-like isoform X2 [Ostrea edulis]|uniref:HEAT repeat-containing protein 6-like isoform X2 n=1 Tax=Ostrea edulis TaxID=37623 RepID=UPI0020956303|nr:HEAT repeat-containing protein 6-like isoform X2 [Ostrea edulis]
MENHNEKVTFQNCLKRLLRVTYRDDVSSKTDINVLIDELIALDYAQKFVDEEDANKLIQHVCRIIPVFEEQISVKACQIIHSLTAKQQLSMEEQVLWSATEFLVKAIQRISHWATAEILQTLGAVVYENVDRLSQFHEVLLGPQGVLFPLIMENTTSEEILKGAVQCVENLTFRVSSKEYMDDQYAALCFQTLLELLHRVPIANMESGSRCKILICSLRGIQNLLTATKIMPSENLGPLLAGIRAFMFHGLPGAPISVPDSLYPTPLSQYDPSPTNSARSELQANDETSAKSGGGKKYKKKKAKKGAESTRNTTAKSSQDKDDENDEADSSRSREAVSFRPNWAKISSSESEYSDTEGGQSSQLRSLHAKVRQCALACLHTTIKNINKRVIFGYWSSFIPDSNAAGNSPQVHTLFTVILKDPSPKCRMGALAALTALVDGTKTLLATADDSDQKSTAFVPFSAILGSTIRELHRCLLLALVSENIPLTLTQLIKCISTLIANVPYSRMRTGLLSRVVKQIRNFISYRDPNVRVACLTCLGAVAAIQPPLMEVCHIIRPTRPPSHASVSRDTDHLNVDSGINSGSRSNCSPNTEAGILEETKESPNLSPRMGTPMESSSGTQTPVFSDVTLQAHARNVSWLVKLCVRNILPYPGENGEQHVEPLPVRLESLQVLAHLSKGYFPIIRNSLSILQDLILRCFADQDQVVRLHTSKLVDDLTQALQREIQSSELTDSSGRLSLQQVTNFWISLLNGAIADILQTEGHCAVKATTCDCVSNIGPEVYAALPMDKQVLCITLILGLTSEEDKIVRSSALRTVGVFVLFPCLREDVCFVADAANAILTSMEDTCLNVRFKTAWSLANLCDSLVLNKIEGDDDFMSDFSDMLLQKLFTTSIKACQDNDKVKSNAVRAVGNILRYLPIRSLGKSSFRTFVEEGVKALIKNISSGTMKLRWNACYAVSNMFKNTLLNFGGASWTRDLMMALCAVVKDCKNFKVRINAALALGSPSERSHYGDSRLFTFVWENLFIAFETSEDITDFAEFKYRNSLNSQICTSILHLVTLLQAMDLDLLHHLFLQKSQVISVHFDRFRTSPQESNSELESDLIKARDHLLTLLSGHLNEDQRSALCLLQQVCRIDENLNEEERIPEKTAFKQIYD